MNTSSRHLGPLDTLLTKLDRLLKYAAGPHVAGRSYPAADLPETVTDPAQRRQIAGLMRVNHAGEICAQALYHAQAATAKRLDVRDTMNQSAREEVDHLSWCAQRLEELGDRPSLLDPLWYLGAYAIGTLAGISGDHRSLGFVAETERQVVAHLQSHVNKLQQKDARTQAILEQMIADEARHGGAALEQGGELPPAPLRLAMKLTAKIMTATAQHI
ncbi:MAG: 2-polyprenyl-3-methyl-6-methoxy-1,4-benzoquinone monooxygenase [Steroidobacteraceae bacterium]